MKNKSTYELLNDRNWLVEKYINQKLSTSDISKLIGCATDTVVRNMKILNIPIRSLSDRRRVKRDDFFKLNIPVLNGSLLGDSFITKPHSVGWNSCFRKKNVNYDHLLYFASKMVTDRAKDRISGPFDAPTNLTQNGNQFYMFSTYKHPELTELRAKWYPFGAKIIPRDIVLTEESLLHWFLDDGFSYVVNYKGKLGIKPHIRVCFCTNSFSKEDLIWVCDMIYKKFKLKFHLGKKGKGYILILKESQSNKFFDLIGPCPIESLKYKWKLV